MAWEDVLELSPARLKLVTRAVDRKHVYAKFAVFDAQAALIDENPLSQLNAELRETERD